MSDRNPSKVSPLAPVIVQAQQELMSAHKFYRLCKQVCQQSGQQRLYFCEPDASIIDLKNGIGPHELRKFLDYLAKYVSRTCQEGHQEEFYLKRVWLRLRGEKTKRLLIIKSMSDRQSMISANSMKIEVEIAGAGMIGRVARIRINQGKDLAFKAFFDPELVWQHGPWAEIPIGIRLKYCQVTKDLPEFLFAGQDWMVWEWIYPHTTPQHRHRGITYEQFAQAEGLTKLNPLNRNNYNPHNIRLDPGGIQKDYLGRRLHNFFWSIVFYARKARREGIKPHISQFKMKYNRQHFIELSDR